MLSHLSLIDEKGIAMFSRIIGTFLLILTVQPVSAEIFQYSTKTFQSHLGAVVLEQHGEPEDYGNRVAKIYLDEELIYEEKEYPYVYLKGHFKVGESSLIIVAVTDGGNACPAFYKIIDINSKTDILTSKEFGTCSDLIKAKLDGRSLKITIPAMHPEDSRASWEYYERKLADKRKISTTEEFKENALFYKKIEHNSVSGKISLVTRDININTTHITLNLGDERLLEDHNFKFGSIAYYYPRDTKAKFIVVSLQDKNDGCDSRYRLFEFDTKGLKHKSPEVGNCGAWPFFDYMKGGIYFSFKKTSSKPYEQYYFKNGNVRKVKLVNGQLP